MGFILYIQIVQFIAHEGSNNNAGVGECAVQIPVARASIFL